MLYKEDVIVGIDNGATFTEGLTRVDRPISSTRTYLAHVGHHSNVAVCEETTRELSEIDIAAESRSLVLEGLITEKQGFEIQLREKLLTKLLSIDPPLKLYQLSNCFWAPEVDRAPIALIAARTWDALRVRGVKVEEGMTPTVFAQFLPEYMAQIEAYFTEAEIARLRDL